MGNLQTTHKLRLGIIIIIIIPIVIIATIFYVKYFLVLFHGNLHKNLIGQIMLLFLAC